MTIGVRQAKAELTRLINSALEGNTVIISNHGKPLVRLVPEGSKPSKNRGFGCLKAAFELPTGWDSAEAEDAFVNLFEDIQPSTKPAKKSK